MTPTGQTTQNSVVKPVAPPGTNHNQIQWLHRAPFQNQAVALPALTVAGHLLALPTSDSNKATGQWIVSPILTLASIRRLCAVIGHATSAISLSATAIVFSLKEMLASEVAQGEPQVIEYIREPLMALTLATSSTAQLVNTDSKIIRDPAGVLLDRRWVDTITVSTDYTLRVQAANMQMRAAAGLKCDQLWDGDGSPQLAIAVRAPSAAGIWIGLGAL